ncbi:MAG: WD40/YVTN/BNR-like repeat-containing protein, partial [Stellaceae bacterium]
GGVWVSDDGEGVAWRPVSNGLTRRNVYSLAARCGGGVTLFAGTEPAALYRSDDLGANWRELPALRAVPGTEKWTFPPPPHIAHVKCIPLYPRRRGMLYVCVEQGALLKTEDDGESWTELDGYVRPDDATYRDTHRLELHPAQDGVLFLTTGLGLNRSGDWGRSWETLTRRGERLGYPDFIAFDARNGQVALMTGAGAPPQSWLKEPHGANAAVLKSCDGGRSWRELENGLPRPIVGSIEALGRHDWATGSSFAFATAIGEVFESDDAGEHWTRIATGLAAVSKAGHFRAFVPRAERPGEGLAAFA